MTNEVNSTRLYTPNRIILTSEGYEETKMFRTANNLKVELAIGGLIMAGLENKELATEIGNKLEELE